MYERPPHSCDVKLQKFLQQHRVFFSVKKRPLDASNGVVRSTLRLVVMVFFLNTGDELHYYTVMTMLIITLKLKTQL